MRRRQAGNNQRRRAAVPGAQLNLPLARRPYVEPPARHNLGRMDIECSHCRAYHWLDERLAGSSASHPRFGSCCNQGQVSLPPLAEPPVELRALFDRDTPDALEFRENIRQYNSALAFTSLGVDVDHAINDGGGPRVFGIHGELCHRIGELAVADGRQPSYAQLYIYDPNEALRIHMGRNNALSERTMRKLQTILIQHHRYVTVFQQAHNLLQQYPEDSSVTIHLLADPSCDQHRYNLPTVSEIAAIVPGSGTDGADGRDIVLHRHGGGL